MILDYMDKGLGCVYQRGCTTDEKNHSAVAGEEPSNRTELIMNE